MPVSDLALLRSASPNGLAGGSLPEMIRILRKHLGMDIAFLGEFYEGKREITFVDTDEENCPVQPGLCTPEEESYCRLIIDGRLPALMNDVRDFPIARALAVTEALRIGSYIAAPIHLSDGSVYGTLCCYSHTPEASLNRRDLSLMQACAEMAAQQLDQEKQALRKEKDARSRITALLSSNNLRAVYQPIFDLIKHRIVGFEALSRSENPQGVRPDILFREAHEVGLGAELEIRAIQLALQGMEHLHPDIYLSVNVSPDTILHPCFAETFSGRPLDRITLEITEHAAIEHYQDIEAALQAFRRKGMQLAVDDAGAGFSSFRHILELCPDRIKLDWTLTKDVDADPSRRALIAAFVRFSKDTGSRLIAEGVETERDLCALRELGVGKAQGNYLGRPMPLQQAIQTLAPYVS